MNYEKHFNSMMSKARKKNADLDEIDHGFGFATPLETGNGELLRTAIMAIVASVGPSRSIEALYEGLALLEQLHDKMHPNDPHLKINLHGFNHSPRRKT